MLSASQIIQARKRLIQEVSTDPEGLQVSWAGVPSAVDWTQPLIRTLQIAECYRVSAPMSDLVRVAISRLGSEEVADLTSALSPAGIVYLNCPWPVLHSLDSTYYPARWLIRGPLGMREGIQMAGVTLLENLPGAAIDIWLTSVALIDGWRIGSLVREVPEPSVLEALSESRPHPGPGSNSGAFLSALGSLMGQETISDHSAEHVRKTAIAESAPANLGSTIATITLRRIHGEPSGEHEARHWRHRWMVRGQ